jgi:hypothetical protein
MERLPSLDTLRVFSIAARHMSFTKAAGELHLAGVRSAIACEHSRRNLASLCSIAFCNPTSPVKPGPFFHPNRDIRRLLRIATDRDRWSGYRNQSALAGPSWRGSD